MRTYFERVERADTLAAVLGLVVAIALFPIQFYVPQSTDIFVRTIPVVIGVASGLYLLEQHRTRSKSTTHRELGVSLRGAQVLQILAVFGLASMVVIGVYSGGRTIPFYAVAAVVGALIFAQIFFLKTDVLTPTPVLLQILVFALITRGIALVTTASTIGVDSWVHLPEYANSLYLTGDLWAIAASKYFGAPLYHLLVAGGARIFGSSLQTALYVTLGVVMPVSVLLVYSTVGYFLATRWALFAAAAFSVSDHVVRWGIHLIPTSMGLVFFLGVFYGTARIYAVERTWATYVLVLIFGIATILTHQISTFIMLVFLGAGAAVQVSDWILSKLSLLDRRQRTVNMMGLFAVLAPLTAVDWYISPPRGTSFLEGMLVEIQSRLDAARLLDLASTRSVQTDAVAQLTTTTPTWMQLLNGLGFLLLLCVTLLGVFTLLQYQHRELLSLSWTASTGVMLFVTLGLPLAGLYFLIPGRWYAFMYVPMVVVSAFGLSHLELKMPSRQLVGVLVVFALLFPGAMLVNNKATHDRPIENDHYQRFAFSESEIAAAETLSEIHRPDEPIRADQPYFIYLRDANGMAAMPLQVTDRGTISGEYRVQRDYQNEGVTQVEYGGETIKVMLPKGAVCGGAGRVLYTNGEIRYCQV